MNTTNILLGATSLLLIIGLVLSFGGFSKSKNDPASKAELAEIKAELAQLEAQNRALELNRFRRQVTPIAPVTPIATAPTTSQLDDQLKAQLRDHEEKIAKLESDNLDLNEKAKSIEAENEKLFEEKTEARQEDRMAAFRVKNALTLGTVISADKLNGFAIFQPSPEANSTFQPGRVLAVRRNDGIIGNI